MQQPDEQRQAVVIGGSMAGLVAARVLADHYPRVLLVERDVFPRDASVRAGVPQARHVHVLLARGKYILEQLFPNLPPQLDAAGAPLLDWTGDAALYSFGGWKPRVPFGLMLRTCTRALLELLVRQQVEQLANVRFLTEHEVVGLNGEAGRCVSGVRVRRRGAGEQPEQTLAAELVVDASGRSSHAPEWLAGLGFGVPREETVNAFLGYASRVYRPDPDFAPDWQFLLVLATPPTVARGGVIMPVEGGRWMVTLAGAARDYPPTDEEGFLAFAESLPGSPFADALQHATPESGIAGYRRTENRFRHYEELARWPRGFVVLGDAASAFNPVYGQGMSAAASAADTLDQYLRQARDDQAWEHAFQRRLAAQNRQVWLLATGEDFRYPETEGVRPNRLTRVFHRYADRVQRAAALDPQVYFQYMRVLNLLAPPTALFAPRVLVPAMLYGGPRPPQLTDE